MQNPRVQYNIWSDTGAVILHAAASGRTAGSTFYTHYNIDSIKRPFEDHIFTARVDESDDTLVHRTVFANVTASMAETFRKELGIGHPKIPDMLESFGDPSGPSSMRFTSQYSRGSA